MEPTSRRRLLAHIADLVKTHETHGQSAIFSATKILQETMDLLREHRPHYHWVGLYGLVGKTLYLGPFAGPPTDHVEIPVGRGVCGTAVQEGSNQRVDDVSQRDNYLACNLETKSELVVLIWSADPGTPQRFILGQIDVDGSTIRAFDEEEEAFIADVAVLLRQPMALWLQEKNTQIQSKES